jgi:predicted outer membrane protein
VELGNLMATSAADFDAAYLQGQLADHERVITLVASLLTMSSDAAVKEQLNALSTLTKGHQTQAKSLRSSL